MPKKALLFQTHKENATQKQNRPVLPAWKVTLWSSDGCKVGKNPKSNPKSQGRSAQHYPESSGITRSRPESFEVVWSRSESFGVVWSRRSRPDSAGAGVGLRNKGLYTKCTRKVKDKTQLNEMYDHNHIVPDGSCWLRPTVIPINSKRLWTTPKDYDSRWFLPTPADSRRLRTTLDDSGRLRTPDDFKQPQTVLVVWISPKSESD